MGSESKQISVTISVANTLLDEFDGAISGAGYPTRSAALSEAMRDLIQKLHKRR